MVIIKEITTKIIDNKEYFIITIRLSSCGLDFEGINMVEYHLSCQGECPVLTSNVKLNSFEVIATCDVREPLRRFLLFFKDKRTPWVYTLKK
jgi:hypothetical protein